MGTLPVDSSYYSLHVVSTPQSECETFHPLKDPCPPGLGIKALVGSAPSTNLVSLDVLLSQHCHRLAACDLAARQKPVTGWNFQLLGRDGCVSSTFVTVASA